MSAPADEVGRAAREKLLDHVRADPALAPHERETTVTFAVDEDSARVFCEEAALVRRLLAHDGVDVEELGVLVDGERRTVTVDEAVDTVDDDDLVVRLRGRIPIRYLLIGERGARSHDDHAAVVTQEVFGR